MPPKPSERQKKLSPKPNFRTVQFSPRKATFCLTATTHYTHKRSLARSVALAAFPTIGYGCSCPHATSTASPSPSPSLSLSPTAWFHGTRTYLFGAERATCTPHTCRLTSISSVLLALTARLLRVIWHGGFPVRFTSSPPHGSRSWDLDFARTPPTVVLGLSSAPLAMLFGGVREAGMVPIASRSDASLCTVW
ncbi:MAG: hypothetical protein M1819_004546 [Sarea resinae]|nr:MAG: hypothetical protein M1819_004546 [Sarea resinae]